MKAERTSSANKPRAHIEGNEMGFMMAEGGASRACHDRTPDIGIIASDRWTVGPPLRNPLVTLVGYLYRISDQYNYPKAE